tara:strand:+ start:91 stop:495 length:405 start_codon:yes stop_codon:yes gene_type:complete
MAIPKIYKHGIEITKPWSKEMYSYNEQTKDHMIKEIMFCIHSLKSESVSRELGKLVSGYGYSNQYSVREMQEDMIKNVKNAETYWIASVWDDLITADFVKPNFTGDGNEVQHLIGFESRKEILELRKQYDKEEI